MLNANVTVVDERIQMESKCKLSLKQTEPLKSGKLSSKNDVRPLSQDIRSTAAEICNILKNFEKMNLGCNRNQI